jgi:hypothetical protein
MRTAHHTDTADAGFWPVTRSGTWSLFLMALAALAMVTSMVAVAAGQRGGHAGQLAVAHQRPQ